MTPNSLAIGIPVKDRRRFVEMNARSLSKVRLLPGLAVEIVVCDDCSSDFGADLLSTIYPAGARIVRRDTPSGGADFATADLMAQLVALGTDAVMILDSDLILRGDMLSIIRENLPLTDGLLSLFNTDSHPIHGEDGNLVLKRSVGAAGTVWRRDLAQEVVDNVPAVRFWDWRFCDYLLSRNLRLFCLRNSAVQHLGFAEGENSALGYGDFGRGFSDQSVEHLFFITEEIVRAQRRGFAEGEERLRDIERLLSARP